MPGTRRLAEGFVVPRHPQGTPGELNHFMHAFHVFQDQTLTRMHVRVPNVKRNDKSGNTAWRLEVKCH